MEREPAIARQMCDVGQRMWQRGFCAGCEGNLSVRLGAGRVLCTPTGVSKGFMGPGMMVVVDGAGKKVRVGGGRAKESADQKVCQPTSEILLHLAIYEGRADVNAVIHAHTPYATAFACSAEARRTGALPMGIHPEAEVFLGRVPVAKYATPGTAEVGRGCCAVMTERTRCVLMGNHGVACFSDSLTGAWHTLEMLEAYCRLLMLFKQIGPPRRLTKRELAELSRG